jgi:hypothetical protein
MTGHIPLDQKPRARLLEAAQMKLAAFERREREFRKMERKERALYLWRKSAFLEPPMRPQNLRHGVDV